MSMTFPTSHYAKLTPNTIIIFHSICEIVRYMYKSHVRLLDKARLHMLYVWFIVSIIMLL